MSSAPETVRTEDTPWGQDAAEEAECQHQDGQDQILELIPEIEAELAKYLENAPREVPDGTARFVIDSPEAASWVVGKMVALDKREEVLEAQYVAMKKDIKNDRAYLLFRLGSELATWVQANLPRGKRSVKLLTGTAGFRSTPPKLEVVDQQLLLAWAQKFCPEAICEKMTVEVDRGVVKARLEEGQVVPGAVLSDRGEKFYVKGGA